MDNRIESEFNVRYRDLRSGMEKSHDDAVLKTEKRLKYSVTFGASFLAISFAAVFAYSFVDPMYGTLLSYAYCFAMISFVLVNVMLMFIISHQIYASNLSHKFRGKIHEELNDFFFGKEVETVAHAKGVAVGVQVGMKEDSLEIEFNNGFIENYPVKHVRRIF